METAEFKHDPADAGKIIRAVSFTMNRMFCEYRGTCSPKYKYLFQGFKFKLPVKLPSSSAGPTPTNVLADLESPIVDVPSTNVVPNQARGIVNQNSVVQPFSLGKIIDFLPDALNLVNAYLPKKITKSLSSVNTNYIKSDQPNGTIKTNINNELVNDSKNETNNIQSINYSQNIMGAESRFRI